MKRITIGICHYPNALKSAVFGLEEMFLITNSLCQKQDVGVEFEPVIFDGTQPLQQKFSVILLPPSSQSDYYLNPEVELIELLKAQHSIAKVPFLLQPALEHLYWRKQSYWHHGL